LQSQHSKSKRLAWYNFIEMIPQSEMLRKHATDFRFYETGCI